MSQLRYLFVECSYVFWNALELRYILVRLNYVQKLHTISSFFSYVRL